MSCGDIPTYNPFINPEYLSEMHKISIEEARLLVKFANSHTIRYKECYGDGSIIFPMWLKENEQADKAIQELTNQPIPHEEKHGYVNPMEKPYKFPSVPRWLGSLIGMIVSACFLWWPHILRMLNSFLQ